MTANNYIPASAYAASAINWGPLPTALAEQALKITSLAGNMGTDRYDHLDIMSYATRSAAAEYLSSTTAANNSAAAQVLKNYGAQISSTNDMLKNIAPSTTAGLLSAMTGALPSTMDLSNFLSQGVAQGQNSILLETLAGITSSVAFDTSAVSNLAAKLGTFKVSSWDTAKNLAVAMPEVVAAAREVAEERPEVAEDLVATITTIGLPAFDEMSKSQRIGVFKEAGVSATGVFMAGQYSSSMDQLIFGIIIAMIWFAVGMRQIDAEVIEGRKKD